MINPQKRQRVVDMLREGAKHRDIKKETGVPLATISKIRQTLFVIPKDTVIPLKKEGITTCLSYADAHVDYHDKESLDVMVQIAQDVGIDIVCNHGDAVNADGISKYTNKKMERGVYDTKKELEYFRDNVHLPLLKALKPIHSIWCGGNHGVQRIQDLFAKLEEKQEEPELIQHFREQLDIVKMFPETKICEWNKGFWVGKLFMTHGFYYNDAHAKKSVQNYGCNVLYGHVHTHQTYLQNTRGENQPHEGSSLGCMCNLSPAYKKGAPNAWQHGFAITYFYPNGSYNKYHVNVIDGKAIWNGKLYTGRNKELSELIK